MNEDGTTEDRTPAAGEIGRGTGSGGGADPQGQSGSGPPAGSGAGSRSATGIDPNLCAALAYVGWAVTGLLFYMIEPDNRFVRFHAMQSILLTAALFVAAVVFGVVPLLGHLLFSLASVGFVIIWLVAMWKALRHEEYLLPFIGEIARAQVNRKV